jgi:hypothetical protein
MMFKILVRQAQNNLFDKRAEYLINDRLSFMRFLGLSLGERVLDVKTIGLFRERLNSPKEKLIRIGREGRPALSLWHRSDGRGRVAG